MSVINQPPLKQAFDDPHSKWPEWFGKVYTICFSVQESGTTANRPTNPLWVGRGYYDTTIGLPIYYNGSVWKDAAGNTV